MSQTYFAILTAIGEAKLANAAALNTTLKISKMAVGDGGGSVPTPDRSQTALKGEWYRAGLNSLTVDKANSSQVNAELVIPETTGGSWIREMGLIDADGNLIAVANTPPSYKPQLAEGSGRTQVLRMVLIVSSTSNVELKIDPSVVLATRGYVDDAITVAINRLDNKQSVRAATTANITLSGLQTIDGIALVAGDRVLVKSQTTANGNGIYVAGSGGWLRAADADENAEVTPGLTVFVEQGTTQADTIWKLTTDAPITLGSTELAFADITAGYAPLASPTFSGDPKAPTPAQFDKDTSLATTEFAMRIGHAYQKFVSVATSTTLGVDQIGSLFHLTTATAKTTVTLPPLSGSVPSGGAILIHCAQSIGASIVPPLGTALYSSSGLELSSLDLYAGDTVELVAILTDSAPQWRVFGGTVQARNSAASGAQGPLRGSALWNTAGTYQWIVPANVYRVWARCMGGGGSGGYPNVAGSSGGGGGAGGHGEGIYSVTPGDVITITVGAGGAAVTSGSGNSGGTSSFGSFLSCTGGSGGIYSGGGAAGGAGGSCSGANIVSYKGQDGGCGVYLNSGNTSNNATGGCGGGISGGRGAAGQGTTNYGAQATAGGTGSGGGGGGYSNSVAAAGAAGGAGEVSLRW
ncbi:phage tail protein [Pseudomonas sp. JZ134]|uniref:phage tail protein n=1 Tax=Pseudomonas sp. JZ134 TaxID=2806615 RepID=UPI003DA02FBA